MKKPPRTFLLVEGVLDENDVPYLVADPRAPSRRVGVRRKAVVPAHPDHFAEHFELHAHVVDTGTDPRNLAHYEAAAAAKTLAILNRCQAASFDEAAAKLVTA